MESVTARQLIKSHTMCCSSNKHLLSSAHHPSSQSLAYRSLSKDNGNYRSNSRRFSAVSSSRRNYSVVVKSSAGVTSVDDGEGVSLGTMRLPPNTDIPRFETLLFQWANSLCQGAQLPLPVPLKVDKIEGGVRLGFVEIDEGQSNVPVYINCIIIPGSNNNSDPPLFKATRNGARKNKVPPGEPRIMKSLLGALQKSVEIARV